MQAEAIARALAGHKAGTTWMARCPAHNDREPSLAIRDGDDGRILVRCHAGCSQRAVVDALQARGIWTQGAGRRHAPATKLVLPAGNTGHSDFGRTTSALRLWADAVLADGTLVAAYLRSRGLVSPPPGSIRFHPALRHPTGGTWPAMVALVTAGADAVPIAVHRTFLTRDGAGKAPVSPAKMMLGPCRGGVVRLAEATTSVAIGEGIETCLSVMQATGKPAWAALSTSGLRALQLPGSIAEVIVLADGDDPGEGAARCCANRWASEGRQVRIARPPVGKDFNDVLLQELRQ